MRPYLPLAALVLLPAASFAADIIAPGTVACLSRRNAEDYHRFAKEAPAFAEDELARANCYRVASPTTAIRRSTTAGLSELQLLSGHKVWVPNASVTSLTAK